MWSEIQKILRALYHPHRLPLTDKVSGETWLAGIARGIAFKIDLFIKRAVDRSSIILGKFYYLKTIKRCCPAGTAAVCGNKVMFVKDCDGVWTGETGTVKGFGRIDIANALISLVSIRMDSGDYVSVQGDYIRIMRPCEG